MKLLVNEVEYEVVKDYKNGFDKEAFLEKFTSYFEPYDYILGDWAYNKLRLKGFCDKNNKICNNINDYSKIEEYIKESCAYDCRYFIVKKSQ